VELQAIARQYQQVVVQLTNRKGNPNAIRVKVASTASYRTCPKKHDDNKYNHNKYDNNYVY